MADLYDVKLTVVSQEGTCVAGHKVGDEFVCPVLTTPAGVCVEAFHALYPSLWTLMVGGSFPWSGDPDTVRIACPDHGNPVMFELRRVRPEE